MSGHVGNLSQKQEDALKQFRENVGDVLQDHHDDHFLLKWLRARSFDLKKSEKMLRDSLEYRKKIGIDDLLEKWTPPEVLTKYYPGGQYGFDREGYPVWIDTLGYADVRGLMFSAKKIDAIKYKAYWTEKLYKVCDMQSAKMGKRIDQVVLLFDMEKIGMKHLWKPAVDVFTEILSVFEANYPETLRYALVVNAPRIFPIAYNIAKPFLSEDTKKKIVVLGGNWKEKVQEHIAPDQLPVHWGGTCTDPDGDIYCKSRVCMGGEIPKDLYMQKSNFVDMSNFTSITVGRGSSEQIECSIDKPGCVLRWQFMSEGNDIRFGVFRRTAEARQKAGDMIEVVPSDRVNSHMVPEDGSITCDEQGTYVLRFDNTYSWVMSKKIKYLLEILQPDQHTTDL